MSILRNDHVTLSNLRVKGPIKAIGAAYKRVQFMNGLISTLQCPKLRVHPAPGVHIFTAGCTIFGGVHPVCARSLSHLLLLCIGRVHGTISGCTVLWEVHPASAQNKILISDTALLG